MYHKIIRDNSKTFKQKNPQNKALGIFLTPLTMLTILCTLFFLLLQN